MESRFWARAYLSCCVNTTRGICCYAALLVLIVLSIVDAQSDVEIVSLGSQPNAGEYTWVASSTLSAGLVCVMLKYSPPTQGNVTIRGPPFYLQESASEVPMSFLSPAEGDMLQVGTSHHIAWTSPASAKKVNATLYVVQPWTGLRVLLFKGVDENAFDWTPGLYGTGFQLELYDATSKPFSISPPQPFVKITSIFDGQDGALWARGRNATVFVETSDP